MFDVISRAPLDIWVLLSQFLPLQAILNLQYTCKYLYRMMDERIILEPALRRLLHTIPLPRILRTINSISTENIRRTLLKITHLDRNEQLTSFTEATYHYSHTSVLSARFLPGGDFIVILLPYGVLHVAPTLDFRMPESKVSPPSVAHGQDVFRLYVSLSALYGPLVILLQLQSHREWRSKLSLYTTDPKKPALDCLRTLKIHRLAETCCAHGDLLAYGYTDGRLYVTIRSQHCPEDEEELSVVMDLSCNAARVYFKNHTAFRSLVYTLSILSHRLLLVSDASVLRLYEIPDRRPISEDFQVECSPFWTYRFPTAVDPYQDKAWVSPIIWDTPSGKHIGSVTILSVSTIVVLSPSHIPEECHVEVGSLGSGFTPYYPAVGYSRVIWLTSDVQPISLHAATYFKPSLGPEGLLRGSEVDTLLPQVQSLQINPDETYRRVRDISWDEESGRICVLYHLLSETAGFLKIDSL